MRTVKKCKSRSTKKRMHFFSWNKLCIVFLKACPRVYVIPAHRSFYHRFPPPPPTSQGALPVLSILHCHRCQDKNLGPHCLDSLLWPTNIKEG